MRKLLVLIALMIIAVVGCTKTEVTTSLTTTTTESTTKQKGVIHLIAENATLPVNKMELEYGEILLDHLKTVVPTKEGYTFTQWVKDDRTPLTNTDLVSQNSIVLHAEFRLNAYTLNFNLAGGTLSDSSVVMNYNESILVKLLEYSPVKEGFKFISWVNKDGNTLTNEVMTEAGFEVYATYEALNFQVTLHAQNGYFEINNEAVFQITLPYDTEEIQFENPLIDQNGYAFEGWYLDQNLSEKWNGKLFPRDFDLYAKFTLQNYRKVEFYHGETLLNTEELIVLSGNKIPAFPSDFYDKELFEAEWYTENAEYYSLDTLLPSSKETLKLYAQVSQYFKYAEIKENNVVVGYELQKYNYNDIVYTSKYVDVKIPKYHLGLPVIKLSAIFGGSNADYSCKSLKSVWIPNTVVEINGTFQNCINLAEVNFEDDSQLKRLLNGSFYGCSSIKEIVLPESLTDLRASYSNGVMKEIGNYDLTYSAFGNCASLEKVTFSSKLEYIGRLTFLNCNKIREFNIPTSLLSVGTRAFENAGTSDSILNLGGNDSTQFATLALFKSNFKTINLKGIAQLPDSNVPINKANNANLDTAFGFALPTANYPAEFYPFFLKCDNLQFVNFDGAFEVLGKYAFYGSNIDLTNLTFANSVIDFKEGVFYKSNFKNALIFTQMNVIPKNAFAFNTALETVTLKNNVTAIEDFAFEGCTSLEAFNLTANVTTLKATAFKNCTSFYRAEDGLNYSANRQFNLIEDTEGNPLYLVTKDGKKLVYDFNPFAEIKVLPEGIERVPALYSGYVGLEMNFMKSLLIPQSVKVIDDEAFQYQSGLTTLIWKSNPQLQIIGARSFNYCKNLQFAYYENASAADKVKFLIPNTVETIGQNTFDARYTFDLNTYLDENSTIDVEDADGNVTKQTNYGYYSNDICSSYNGNSFAETNIQDLVFEKNSRLMKIYNSSFAKEDKSLNLTPMKITFAEEGKELAIGSYAFRSSSLNLNDFTIPSYVVYLGNRTLLNVQNVIWDQAKSLKMLRYTFADSVLLKDVILPNSLEKLDGAFYKATVPTITFEEGFKASIGSNVFNTTKFTNETTLDFSELDIKFEGTEIISTTTNLSKVILDQSSFQNVSVTTFKNFNSSLKVTNKANEVYGIGILFKSSKINALELAEGIKVLEKDAFYFCTSLVNVILPDSLEEIGDSAFEDLAATSIVLPKNLKRIKEEAFYSADIKNIILPEGLEELSYRSFSKATIVSVSFPSTLKSIPDAAFESCTSLKEVILPDTIESVGKAAFKGCTSLSKFYFGNGVSEVKDEILSGCSKLVDVKLGSVPQITKSMFNNCSILENLEIPNTVTAIGETAFKGCNKLLNLTLPSSVKEVGATPFGTSTTMYKTIDFEAVNDVESLDTIGLNAFQYCYLPHSKTNGGFSIYKNNGFMTLTSYSGNDLVVNIPDKVQALDLNVFNNKALTEIIFPKGFRKINDASSTDSPFLKSSLTKVTFLDAEESNAWETLSIGKYAFSNVSLGEINFPKNLYIELNDYAFQYNAKSLMMNVFTITANFTKIGSNCFKGQGNINQLIFENRKTPLEIGGYAFQDCVGLAEVQMGDNISIIGSSAFKGCTKLEKVFLPGTVSKINSSAFEGCSKLSLISLPADLVTIGSSAFLNCTSLKAITLSEGLTSLESSAFKGCISLQEITLPASMTSIGSSVFEGCTSLKSAKFGNKNNNSLLVTLNTTVFKNCLNLKEVLLYNDGTIKLSSASSTSQPFYGCTNVVVYISSQKALDNLLTQEYWATMNEQNYCTFKVLE